MFMSGGRSGAVDDPELSPDAADVLRLPDRSPVRVADGNAATASGRCPTQVCHEWNTVAHLNDYEGNPARRPLGYDELQALFDFLDERVDRVARSGSKGHWRRCVTPR